MSNSGYSICRLAQSGARVRDLDVAIRIAHDRPGITGFAAAWLRAGGEIDSDGNLTGMTGNLTSAQLAKVYKMPSRLQEAVDKGKLRKGEPTVKTQAKATGFYPLNWTPMREHIKPAIASAIQQAESEAATPAAKDALKQIRGLLSDD